MNHSLYPMLHEYVFGVANALLTLPRAVGNLAGNPTLLQLGIMPGRGQRRSLTHGKSFDNDEIDA